MTPTQAEAWSNAKKAMQAESIRIAQQAALTLAQQGATATATATAFQTALINSILKGSPMKRTEQQQKFASSLAHYSKLPSNSMPTIVEVDVGPMVEKKAPAYRKPRAKKEPKPKPPAPAAPVRRLILTS